MDEVGTQTRNGFELRNFGSSSGGPEEWLWLWLGAEEGRGLPATWDGSAASVKISHSGPASRSQRETVVLAQVVSSVFLE